MSRPQTRKELAEAGRRKLEAFRKQKAKADSLKPVTKDTNALLAASASVSQASSPAAQAASIDAQLVRATSVLPVSTYAQPVSVDGSEEDAPGLLTHNPSAASHPEAVEDRATAASSFASVAAVANSGRTADGGAPDQQAPSPSATPVRIPFTGVTAGHSFSRSQQPPPQAAAVAAAAAATAAPTSTTYRSRLPPPPPVFKPPTSRSQANTLQNSTSSAPGQSTNLSPWRPAVLKGSAKGTPFTGQPSGALFSPPSPPPVSQFHPTQPGYRHNSASPRHHQLASPSSRKPAGSFSMTRPQEATPEMTTPAASSLSVSSGSGSGKEAEAEAVTSPSAQAASQLSLVNERQLLPGLSVGPDHSGAEMSEAVGSLLTERESGLAATPAQAETLTSTPGGMKAAHRFAAEAESPDSPLLFPWSQGPKSTGAASAYASLSDSYLSRPPSQTPSQAPSPSKRAQHSTPSSASPPQHARRDAAFAASSPQHAKRDTANSNAYGTVAMSSSLGPMSPAQRASQLAPHTVSSVFGSGASATPGSSTFSPSTNARPSVGAQAAEILNGPPSNGPVSVAPWRQPMVTSSRAQAPLFLPSQADSSSSSSGGVLSTMLPDLPSQAQSGARFPSQAALPAQAREMLPGSASPAADAADQDLQQQPSTGPDDSFAAMLQQQQQKPGGLTQEAGVPLPWGRPSHQERTPTSDSLLLPLVRGANGSKGDQTELVSAASGSSNSDSLLSGAADSSRPDSGAVSGSMPSLQKGLGSHVSLADSLANGTLPAKANNFTALQQHIDDLTQEKFELVRGLREQQKVAASLAEENLLVTEDFNRQAEALQQTRKELQHLEGHLQGQQHSMDQLAAERDACKSGAHEAADRSKSLAAEVVALEERVLQVRSREIRLEKETGRLQEGQEQAEKQLQASKQDRASLQATVDMLQEEKRSLQVKLRQAAAQSDAASTQADAAEKQRASSQQAQPRPTLPRRQQQQLAALDSASATSSGVDDRREAKSAAEVMDTRQHSGAGASTSSRLADAVLAMHPSPPPQQQPATSSLQGGLSRSLAKLLPKGPGAAEQRQMLESIHAVIGDLEVEKQSFLVTLTSQQAELQTLTAVNSDLQRKLESQTQRLELAIQQQAHASPHAAVSSSSSVFINGSASHAMRPQLQHPGPQLQLGAQTKQPQPGAQWQPSGGLEAASNGGEHTVEEQFSELPPGHGSQYVRSAPPTPQQVAQRPLRAPRGSRPSGVIGWLGNVIAPRPKPQQADLMA